jgi:hypothetical protein
MLRMRPGITLTCLLMLFEGDVTASVTAWVSCAGSEATANGGEACEGGASMAGTGYAPLPLSRNRRGHAPVVNRHGWVGTKAQEDTLKIRAPNSRGYLRLESSTFMASKY